MNQPQHNNAATQDPGDCYISTFTGAHVSLIAPDPRSIHISDIAQGLATQYRFNGHSHPAYTVAQHSVFVSHQVPAEHALQALLHDATEAYIGDLPAPAKALCPDYKAMEQRLLVAIMERFDLPAALSPEVKHADLIALATEKRELMPQSADEDWPMLHGIQPHPQGLGICLPPDEARTWFLMRYRELTQPKSYTTGGFVPANNSPDMTTNQANAVQVDKNGVPQAPAAPIDPSHRALINHTVRLLRLRQPVGTKLYIAPQAAPAAPDVAALVEALAGCEPYLQEKVCYSVYGERRHYVIQLYIPTDAENPESFEVAAEKWARNALAAHQKREPGQP